MTQGRALVIEKNEMLRLLHADHEFSDRFISYTVTRNLKTEERPAHEHGEVETCEARYGSVPLCESVS